MTTSHLKIEGMSCQHCVATVRQALEEIPGVRSVDVDLTRARASVEHEDNVQNADLTAAITEAGYDAQPL